MKYVLTGLAFLIMFSFSSNALAEKGSRICISERGDHAFKMAKSQSCGMFYFNKNSRIPKKFDGKINKSMNYGHSISGSARGCEDYAEKHLGRRVPICQIMKQIYRSGGRAGGNECYKRDSLWHYRQRGGMLYSLSKDQPPKPWMDHPHGRKKLVRHDRVLSKCTYTKRFLKRKAKSARRIVTKERYCPKGICRKGGWKVREVISWRFK